MEYDADVEPSAAEVFFKKKKFIENFGAELKEAGLADVFAVVGLA